MRTKQKHIIYAIVIMVFIFLLPSMQEKTFAAETITSPLDFSSAESSATDSIEVKGYLWDNDVKMLMLEGLEMNINPESDGLVGISLPANAIIYLEGDNEINITGTFKENISGVFCAGDILVVGDGTLTITVTAAENSLAMNVVNDMDVKGSVELVLKADQKGKALSVNELNVSEYGYLYAEARESYVSALNASTLNILDNGKVFALKSTSNSQNKALQQNDINISSNGMLIYTDGSGKENINIGYEGEKILTTILSEGNATSYNTLIIRKGTLNIDTTNETSFYCRMGVTIINSLETEVKCNANEYNNCSVFVLPGESYIFKEPEGYETLIPSEIVNDDESIVIQGNLGTEFEIIGSDVTENQYFFGNAHLYKISGLNVGREYDCSFLQENLSDIVTSASGFVFLNSLTGNYTNDEIQRFFTNYNGDFEPIETTYQATKEELYVLVYNKYDLYNAPYTLNMTLKPTPTPTPTTAPIVGASVSTTTESTIEPTIEPTVEPTQKPTQKAIEEPTVEPTAKPTVVPEEVISHYKNTTTEEINNIVKNLEDGDILTIKTSTQNNSLSGDVLNELKGKEIDVTVVLENGMEWSFSGKDIETDWIEQDINFNLNLENSKIPEKILEAFIKDQQSKVLSLDFEGEFGFAMKLTVYIDLLDKGKFASIYYYDPNTKAFEFMESTEITETGNAEFDFQHASDYVVLITDKKISKDDMLPEEDTTSRWILISIIVVIVLVSSSILTIYIKKKEKKIVEVDEN